MPPMAVVSCSDHSSSKARCGSSPMPGKRRCTSSSPKSAWRSVAECSKGEPWVKELISSQPKDSSRARSAGRSSGLTSTSASVKGLSTDECSIEGGSFDVQDSGGQVVGHPLDGGMRKTDAHPERHEHPLIRGRLGPSGTHLATPHRLQLN